MNIDEQNFPQSQEPIQTSKNVWVVVVIFIFITSTGVGGMYIWKNNEVNKVANQAMQAQKNIQEQAEQIADLKLEIIHLKDELSKSKENKTIATDNGEFFGWETYTNKNDGYAIMHPTEFWPEYDDTILNYNVDDPESRYGSPDRINIQIQKHTLNSNYSSFDEYITYQQNTTTDLIDSAKVITLGDFITMSQYVKNGPGGSFMVYTAFDSETNNYFDILIFEPGYSNNKELVEQIVSTFKIL